jgi:processed acidic surface protein
MDNFKSMLLGVLLSLSLLFTYTPAIAAPPENELNQYLAEIGWSKQDLLDYLDYYEIPLDDFSTMEDLKMILGTPINSINLQELLTNYNLTEKELNDLLGHFGDSISNYKFIEDLDATVDFYVNHDEYMAEVENGLTEMGITEEETEKFFNYLAQVEEDSQHQLDQMELLDSRLEKFLYVEDTTELSEAEIDELVQILEESISLYEIKIKFAIENKELTLKELLKLKEVPGSLYTKIYSTKGELLIDFTVPAEFFETAETIDQGEDMIHVGELSDEYTDHMHDEKYKNGQNGLK